MGLEGCGGCLSFVAWYFYPAVGELSGEGGQTCYGESRNPRAEAKRWQCEPCCCRALSEGVTNDLPTLSQIRDRCCEDEGELIWAVHTCDLLLG